MAWNSFRGRALNWPRLAPLLRICAWEGEVVEALGNPNQATLGREADANGYSQTLAGASYLRHNLMHDFYSRLERRESGRVVS
jgi:hypothetical protein